MPSPFLSCVRRHKISLLFGLAVLLVFLPSCGAPAPVEVTRRETPRGRTAPQTSFPMPPTTTASASDSAQTFTLLDNQQQTLTDYQGQVVVLDFWATYCPPCLEEAPHLDALQRRFGVKGLRVIGLNVGGSEDHPKIAEFAERLQIKYALGIPEPEMTNLYMGGDSRIPQTIVFDREGRILKHFVGYDPGISQELERTIEKAVMGDKR